MNANHNYHQQNSKHGSRKINNDNYNQESENSSTVGSPLPFATDNAGVHSPINNNSDCEFQSGSELIDMTTDLSNNSCDSFDSANLCLDKRSLKPNNNNNENDNENAVNNKLNDESSCGNNNNNHHLYSKSADLTKALLKSKTANTDTTSALSLTANQNSDYSLYHLNNQFAAATAMAMFGNGNGNAYNSSASNSHHHGPISNYSSLYGLDTAAAQSYNLFHSAQQQYNSLLLGNNMLTNGQMNLENKFTTTQPLLSCAEPVIGDTSASSNDSKASAFRKVK